MNNQIMCLKKCKNMWAAFYGVAKGGIQLGDRHTHTGKKKKLQPPPHSLNRINLR